MKKLFEKMLKNYLRRCWVEIHGEHAPKSGENLKIAEN